MHDSQHSRRIPTFRLKNYRTFALFTTAVHRAVPAHLACRISTQAQAGERNAWPAVVSIALGSFALVFSEVILVGLLADISGHLRVPIGTGGLMVVVPAVAAAVAAPLLALCSASAWPARPATSPPASPSAGTFGPP